MHGESGVKSELATEVQESGKENFSMTASFNTAYHIT